MNRLEAQEAQNQWLAASGSRGTLQAMKTNLLEEAQRLPIEERIELAGAIWDTVAEDAGTDALPVSAAHRLELDRRLADLEADPNAGRSWEEVRERLERMR